MLELWAQIVSDTSRNRTNTKFQLLHAWTRHNNSLGLLSKYWTITALHAQTMGPNCLCHFKESNKHKFRCYMLELWAQIVSATSRNRTNINFSCWNAQTMHPNSLWLLSRYLTNNKLRCYMLKLWAPQLSLPLQGIEQTQISLLHARTMHPNSLCHFKESAQTLISLLHARTKGPNSLWHFKESDKHKFQLLHLELGTTTVWDYFKESYPQ